MTIHFRQAASADAALLAELGAQTFRDSFAKDNTLEDMAAYLAASFSPAKQAAELAAPGSLFLIAEVEGSPAGYARLKQGPAPACVSGAHPVEIVRFYACQKWIGKGIGPALMQACLEKAAELGCDTIWLDVWERNSRAIAFYQKRNFLVVGTQSFQLGSNLQHDLIMARSL